MTNPHLGYSGGIFVSEVVRKMYVSGGTSVKIYERGKGGQEKILEGKSEKKKPCKNLLFCYSCAEIIRFGLILTHL